MADTCRAPAVASGHVVALDGSAPPVRSATGWTYRDLDLDPCVDGDGRFLIDDENELAAACERGHLSATERRLALQAVARARDAFTPEGSRLLQRARRRLNEWSRLQLSPLTADDEPPAMPSPSQ